MSTTSKAILRTVVTGGPEGGSVQSEYSMVNSTGVRVAYEVTVGSGISSATTVSNPVDARWMVIIPASTNANPYRLAMSTAEVGVPLSSQGFAEFTISPSTVASTYYLWTNTTRAFTARVLFY